MAGESARVAADCLRKPLVIRQMHWIPIHFWMLYFDLLCCRYWGKYWSTFPPLNFWSSPHIYTAHTFTSIEIPRIPLVGIWHIYNQYISHSQCTSSTRRSLACIRCACANLICQREVQEREDWHLFLCNWMLEVAPLLVQFNARNFTTFCEIGCWRWNSFRCNWMLQIVLFLVQ